MAERIERAERRVGIRSMEEREWKTQGRQRSGGRRRRNLFRNIRKRK
jgi:hypothetical protein